MIRHRQSFTIFCTLAHLEAGVQKFLSLHNGEELRTPRSPRGHARASFGTTTSLCQSDNRRRVHKMRMLRLSTMLVSPLHATDRSYFITGSCNVYSQTMLQQQLYRLSPLLCAGIAPEY